MTLLNRGSPLSLSSPVPLPRGSLCWGITDWGGKGRGGERERGQREILDRRANHAAKAGCLSLIVGVDDVLHSYVANGVTCMFIFIRSTSSAASNGNTCARFDIQLFDAVPCAKPLFQPGKILFLHRWILALCFHVLRNIVCALGDESSMILTAQLRSPTDRLPVSRHMTL